MSESVLASLDAPAAEIESSPAPEAEQPAAEAQPEAAAPAAESGAKPDKVQTVPHGALHEAREKIRTLTTQIDELRKQPQLSEEDRELLKDLKAQRAAAKEPKPPEFLEDPKGYIDAKEKQVTEALKQLREADTKRSEVEQQQVQLQSLLTTISTHEQAFVATTPDYNDALRHVRTVRTQQLKMMFPDATDAQIQAHIGREELGGAQQILARGGNSAEFAYNYAKTLGYQKKAPAPAGNGMAAAVIETEPKPDKDAVRTLGGGGGAEPDDAPADPMPEFTQALKERFSRKRK
jgi:small-conductance mechanosensitive channel